MTAALRIFSVSDFVRPSDGEPVRSVVLETEESTIVVWYVRPGQEIAAHVHPYAKTPGLFFRVLPITAREAVWLPSLRPEKLPSRNPGRSMEP